ncbi:ligand-binding protein SH3 [Pseudomonas sp. S75]|uniref:SH3 domain-containing protein n=1 Tax=unclassified Pseudomonas TaxID=196821 RepID=UPI001908C85E|nr:MULTISPECIES: SH3 domain-containing protein [unclassified Pseudomonas]MBJ9976371.1 ligand-binding protein SH3 [Pseudomonas sp. S30]MBK0154517.1 ligand-binding protein SH3 [Pseudomonas sp. S75]
MNYVVIENHRSEYPRPIHFVRGALLQIGQRYQGEHDCQDWYLCSCGGQQAGWVPGQLIERLGVGEGRALESYSAHELDVDPGQVMVGLRPLNGWLWCRSQRNGELGWLPLDKLRRLD